ncbi:MAG: FAD-dependent thymidylate synthase [Candidatus Pacearchaeota archaeon]
MKIKFLEENEVIIRGIAAKISQSPLEKSIDEIYDEVKRNENETKELINKIVEKYKHLIFLDFFNQAIIFDNISRLAAIYLWRNVNSLNEIFGCGIEASFRIVKPERFVFEDELFYEAKEIYNKAIEKGIKEQDARYLLPEATLTRLIFSSPIRYYQKLASAFKKIKLDEFQEIGNKIEEIVKQKDIPILDEKLPSEWRIYGYWKNEKDKIEIKIKDKDINSIYLYANISGSLAMFAQLVRQRLNLTIIQPFNKIVEDAEFVIPPSFDEELIYLYKNFAKKIHKKQKELMEIGDSNFVYYLLLGQKARGKLYGCGNSIIKISQVRACGSSQWEIRNSIGLPIFEKLKKYNIDNIGPLCYREGTCIEPTTFKTKKGYCKIFNEFNGLFGNLNSKDIINKLKEKYQTFKIYTKS